MLPRRNGRRQGGAADDSVSGRITKTLLGSITLDRPAEEHHRPRTPTRRTRPASR
ncbi:hypothetical protein [Streptomyces sp. NPDC003247]|uniref:hypothetical protein n=1 Tax=Streptomyces sp. NPDC003247 TaxID=3364677 RepID=UPI003680F261